MADPNSMSQWMTALAGLGGVIAGSLISWGVQAGLLRKRIQADEALAERKFAFDTKLAERRFQYDRDLHDHKRKIELAEQALIAFYEARDVFVLVRSRAIFGGEGSSRTPATNESKSQQEKRNTYFVPIERLTREKQLFARLQSLRYAFEAHFGAEAITPFTAISEVHSKIMTSASILIQLTPDDDDRPRRGNQDGLFNALGWGLADRPDEIDRKIEKAVQDIEALCRPVLMVKPLQ